MDRKVKHRILGFFVVVAAIIILLPLFQSGKDVKSQATLIKAPPFPDQSQQVNAPTPATTDAAESADEITPPTTKSMPMNPTDTSDHTDTHSAKEPVVPAPQAAENTIQLQPDDVITNTIQPVNSASDLATSESASESANEASTPSLDNQAAIDGMQTQGTPIAQQVVSSATDDHAKKITPATHPEKKSKHPMATSKIKNAVHRTSTPATTHTKMHSASISSSSFNNEDLLKLKNPVWVIQLGSFKNKTNALRLVNQLRESGYRAFIQQVNTTEGNSTRVFVGPEAKQTAARALAGELESTLHVRGIVISYEPLAL